VEPSILADDEERSRVARNRPVRVDNGDDSDDALRGGAGDLVETEGDSADQARLMAIFARLLARTDEGSEEGIDAMRLLRAAMAGSEEDTTTSGTLSPGDREEAENDEQEMDISE